MRKDVKIIMAVCVLVLLGLIAYALFLPGGKKSPVASTENSTDNTTASSDDTAAGNGQAVAPATQPSETSVSSAESTTQPSDNSMAGAPTAAPSQLAMNNTAMPTPTPTAAAPASGDWNKLLETGSATPDTNSGTNNSTAAASGMAVGVSAGAGATSGMGTGTMSSDLTPLPNSASASSSEMSSPNTATGERTYIVKSGDTPSSIAQAQYGNRQLYTKILAANPKLNARHMHVGQKIVLPDLSATATARGPSSSGGRVQELGANSASNLPSETGSVSASAAPAGTSGSRYTVAAGDSLQRISTKLYGSSAQWQKIYTLNKSKIGSNPAHLRVGMVLALPKAPTAHGNTSAASSAQPTATGNETAASDMSTATSTQTR